MLGPDAAAAAWTAFIDEGDSLMPRVREISRGAPAGEADRARTHRLAGSAAVLGATDVADRLRSFENALKEGADDRQIQLAAQELLVSWSKTRPEPPAPPADCRHA